MGGDAIPGIVIAALTVFGSVLVAKISNPRGRRTAPPSEVPGPGSIEGLSVSPQIWGHLSGKIQDLEGKVDRLTELVERQTERVTFLERLLRTAMRIIRSQSRTLRKAGLPDEPIPAMLVPYSID
jgi:hypothetical protein